MVSTRTLSVIILVSTATLCSASSCAFNVTHYGAKGDGSSLDTDAIVATFVAANTSQSKGICQRVQVIFPGAPFVFMTGPIKISYISNMEIQLAAGSLIRFSSNRSLYLTHLQPNGEWPALFGIYESSDVTLTSQGGSSSTQGTMDGCGGGCGAGGTAWWEARPHGMGKWHPRIVPPPFIVFQGSTDIVMQNFNVINAPFIALDALSCTNFLLQGLTQNTPVAASNAGTLFLDGLVDSVVRNCNFVSCGDDITTVMSSQRKTKNLTITDSFFGLGQGLSIGSPIKYGLEDVSMTNIVMAGTTTGIRVKAQREVGGVIKNLRYENITMKGVGIMISVSTNFRHEANISSTPPEVNDVLVRNVTGWGDMAGYLDCVPESPCTGWQFESFFPQNSSEVVLPYVCKNFYGTCTNCGSWPRLCDGIVRPPE